jgi:hypothetical protein
MTTYDKATPHDSYADLCVSPGRACHARRAIDSHMRSRRERLAVTKRYWTTLMKILSRGRR